MSRTLGRQTHRSCRSILRGHRFSSFRPWISLLPYVSLFYLISNQPTFSVDVILPSIAWPWLSTLPCLLIILNMFMHYYFACTVNPGFASDLPLRAGNSFIWAKKRQSSRRPLTNGVRWSVDLNMTPASIGRCSKCGGSKPEVRQRVVVGAKTTLLIC